jgi:hypothetical protein
MPYTHAFGPARNAEILHPGIVGCRGVEHVIEVGRSEVRVGGRIEDGQEEGGE